MREKQLTAWCKSLLSNLGLGQRSADFWRSLRNAIFSSGESILTPVLWIISAPIFVAQLGKDHFGIWMLVNGTIGMGGILSFGLTDATIKFVSKYKATQDRRGLESVIRNSLLFYPLLGLLAGLLVYLLAPLLGYNVFKLSEGDRALAVLALRIGGVGIFFRFLDNVFLSVLQGLERHDWNSKITMVATVVMMGTNLVLALLGYGLSAMLITMLICLLTGALVKGWIVWAKLLPGIKLWPQVNRATLREMLGFGVFSGIQSSLNLITMNVDRFIIVSLIGPTMVTYYAISMQVVNCLQMLLARGFGFLFPFASSMIERKDIERSRRIYHQATFLLVVLACALVLPVYLFGESILHVWMGSDFADNATVILQVLCLRYAFLPLSIVNHYYLLGAGLVRVQTVVLSMTSITMVAGMFLLAPRMGAVGVAAAQLLSLPFMLFNRVFIEQRLFREVNLAQSLSYLVPVIAPFYAASIILHYIDPKIDSLVTLALSGLLASAFAGAAAFLLAWIFRRLKWIPS